ncbi:MAG: hypothetical protein KKG99_07350 [Bacteroidetes bacterium]|nr:hypothetical protein [Bacteroidota bacterium]
MRRLFLFLFFILPLISISQNKGLLTGGFESNIQWYSKDQNQFAPDFKDYFRSNNYLKLDYQYKNIFAGVQFESYAPGALLNYDPKLDKTFGLATFFLKYQLENLELTAGYFYEQFGSGLILRLWEDRQLGINNALRGGRIRFTPFKPITLTGIYGNQRLGFEVTEENIAGLNAEIGLNQLFKHDSYSLKLGFSYVVRFLVWDRPTMEAAGTTHSYSSRISFNKNNLYSTFEYVRKGDDALVELGQIIPEKVFKGNALLLNMGYSKSGLGINAAFRRLENMNFYSSRKDAGNIYNRSIINYLPSLTKQHDYGLANIYIYQTQSKLSFNPLAKSGEIGFQFDLFYQIKKGSALGGKYGTNLAINFSRWHGLKATYDIQNRSYNSTSLKFGEKYFQDLNFEVRKKWTTKTFSIFTFINSFYNKKYIEETTGKVDFTIIAAETILKLNAGKSMKFIVQHLWTKDDKKNWAASTYEYNFSSRFSVFVSDMYNYGNDEALDKKHFYNFGGNYSKGKVRISLGYGRQRGGLLCLGGICRVVPESTGFTLTLNTSF